MDSIYFLAFVDFIILVIICIITIWGGYRILPFHKLNPVSSSTRIKIAIITSIYGDYDTIKEHNINYKSNVDWYCFTDNKNIQSNTWQMINTPYHLQNLDASDMKYKNSYPNVKTDSKIYNMMCAKFYKIKTHSIDILQKYDYYIWIDGSILLRQTFLDNIFDHIQRGHELIQFKHSVRDNIKDETYVSIQMPKYKTQQLSQQYVDYMNEGFPDKSGLFENTIIIRKKNDRCNAIFDKWWIHNLKYSYQDQISYPYVLWSLRETPDHIIENNVFNNDTYSYVDFSLMPNHA